MKPENPRVVGSIPTPATTLLLLFLVGALPVRVTATHHVTRAASLYAVF